MAPPLVAWMALRQLRRIQAGPIIYNPNPYPRALLAKSEHCQQPKPILWSSSYNGAK